ncbi:hypoxanthine phosphoribosyltransferase [Patescibacteria group bacterium]|nr:hypoxanthine phosphoribosyltransferase [Patescibacteria group bacterium]
MNKDNLQLYIGKDEIRQIVERVASEIIQSHNRKHIPLVLIVVLKGSIFFVADLMRAICEASDLDVRLDVIGAGSYSGTQSTGNVNLYALPATIPHDARVILIEDIVDTGRTLHALVRWMQLNCNVTPETCTLLDKPCRRAPEHAELRPDFVGRAIPDEFVIGYGLDYDGLFRGLPEIYIMANSE